MLYAFSNGGLTAFIRTSLLFPPPLFPSVPVPPPFHPLTCVNWHGSTALLF
nr:MAG TPA: hypothetical protein [Caudoviricetes sp.]